MGGADYRHDLSGLLDDYVATNCDEGLVAYLVANSRLPGPRGNLELADAFAVAVRDRATRDAERLWQLCLRLAEVRIEQAPVGDPKEFLTFCGARGIAAVASCSAAFLAQGLARLQELARDPRWRVREGVAMGIQDLLSRRGGQTLRALEGWIVGSDWLAMRAVAAAVAEPRLLRDGTMASAALQLHQEILMRVLASDERTSAEFKTLRQGLGYSLSVVICALPREGFAYLHDLGRSEDADVQWIVKENLKKNRLAKASPKEVDFIRSAL